MWFCRCKKPAGVLFVLEISTHTNLQHSVKKKLIMEERQINILLTSFEGLGLPRTLSLQISRDSTVADINDMLLERIPSMAVDASLILTTSSNRKLEPDSMLPLAFFLDQESDLLPIQLSAPLVRGKDFPDVAYRLLLMYRSCF